MCVCVCVCVSICAHERIVSAFRRVNVTLHDRKLIVDINLSAVDELSLFHYDPQCTCTVRSAECGEAHASMMLPYREPKRCFASVDPETRSSDCRPTYKRDHRLISEFMCTQTRVHTRRSTHTRTHTLTHTTTTIRIGVHMHVPFNMNTMASIIPAGAATMVDCPVETGFIHKV